MGVAELTRNAVDVLPAGELERKLALGRPLRVKLGIDPTAPDIHLGHTVVLQKIAAFQREGHVGVLIIGDYTARIGDPSGRSVERRVLPDEVLDANARTYQEQALKILDPELTEIRFNGEWLAGLGFAEILRLTRTTTVAQLLERDDFAKRFASQQPISVSELLYPIMQGYDSVAVEADVELGGTEQLYNLLAGRDVMQEYGLEPQVALTMPILVGTDGHERMSKSRGNYVGVTDQPEEQFGKLMSIPDELVTDYFHLTLDEEPPAGEPMKRKLELARRVVGRYWGEAEARRAEEHFTRVVREGQAPEEVPVVGLPNGDPVHLPALLVERLGLGSTSEARRLIAQGGLRLDGAVVTELDVPRRRLEGALVQAGKRRFLRFRALDTP
jgi:tyrosyl-tRNA synthetase